MEKLFFYIYKNKCNEHFTQVLNEVIENGFSIDTLRNYILDDIKRSTTKYDEPKEDEICLKIDYIGDYEDDGDTTVKGYSIGYKPPVPENENKEETEKYDTIEDPKTFVGSYKGVFIGGALLLTGFILGKRSNKLRPLKKRERYVDPNFLWRRYPDIPNDTRMAIRDEVFDFIFDFMKANDIHFAKRRK